MKAKTSMTIGFLILAVATIGTSCSSTHSTPATSKALGAADDQARKPKAENLPSVGEITPAVWSEAADLGKRYQWTSASKLRAGMEPPNNCFVGEIISNGKVAQHLGTAGGGIPIVDGEMVIDVPGSHDVRIMIDEARGRTSYAGLTFRTPCVLEIRADGTLLADKEDIVASDRKNLWWQSRRITLSGQDVVAFFERPDPATTEASDTAAPRMVDRESLRIALDSIGQSVKASESVVTELDRLLANLKDISSAPTNHSSVTNRRHNRSAREGATQDLQNQVRKLQGSLQTEDPLQIRKSSEKVNRSAGDLRKATAEEWKSADWPDYSGELKGRMEVRIRNPNDFLVRVGLRSGGKGKDLIVAARDIASVRVPNGHYDVYFQYSSEPEALYKGDSFTLANNGIEIQIVRVPHGNYGIRKVK